MSRIQSLIPVDQEQLMSETGIAWVVNRYNQEKLMVVVDCAVNPREGIAITAGSKTTLSSQISEKAGARKVRVSSPLAPIFVR